MIEISCTDAAAVFPLFMQITVIIKSTGIPVLQVSGALLRLHLCSDIFNYSSG